MVYLFEISTVGVDVMDPMIYQLPYYSRHSNMECWNNKTAKNCKSHLNHSFNALALSCTKLDERIKQVCGEELSVNLGIQDRIKWICREEISKLQANALSHKGVSRMVENTEEYLKWMLEKNEDRWNDRASKQKKKKWEKEGDHQTSEENREGVKIEKCHFWL